MGTISQYSADGPRISVNAALKNPLVIRARVMKLLEHQFLMETLLRKLGKPENGVIEYYDSESLFAADDPDLVAEGAEIPLTTIDVETLKFERTYKRALGVDITIEMRDRNNVDSLNRRIEKVKNGMVRVWDKQLFTKFDAAVPTMPASALWSTSSTKIRTDIMTAARTVAEAKDQHNNPLGFKPNTLVMSVGTYYSIMVNEDYAKNFEQNPLSPKAPLYVGAVERQIQGFDVLTCRQMPDQAVYLMERGTVGGYADERPLQVSPTYAIQEREMWRSDVVRRTGIVIDNPKACVKITGVAA